MKKIVLISVLCFFAVCSFAQEQQSFVASKVLRLHVLSPGVEYEMPLYKNLLVSANIGVTYSGSYSNIFGWDNSFSPFVDLELKHLYSVNARIRKGKNTEGNSGNYWGIRVLAIGKPIDVNNAGENTLLLSTVWGLQRTYGKFEMLFDIGPSYYQSETGEGSFLPLIFQLNLGFDLSNLIH